MSRRPRRCRVSESADVTGEQGRRHHARRNARYQRNRELRAADAERSRASFLCTRIRPGILVTRVDDQMQARANAMTAEPEDPRADGRRSPESYAPVAAPCRSCAENGRHAGAEAGARAPSPRRPRADSPSSACRRAEAGFPSAGSRPPRPIRAGRSQSRPRRRNRLPRPFPVTSRPVSGRSPPPPPLPGHGPGPRLVLRFAGRRAVHLVVGAPNGARRAETGRARAQSANRRLADPAAVRRAGRARSSAPVAPVAQAPVPPVASVATGNSKHRFGRCSTRPFGQSELRDDG